MKKLKLKAFAKVNLSLDITGVTDSGMHVLDSVMMSVDKFDTLYVSERADDKITVEFVNADVPCDNNTAIKAARAVHDVIGGCGWNITVEKGIPVGAGLGGSSADGAAVLRALDVMYKLPARGVDMRAVALGVGSDMPFMLTGGLARVRGTGDDLFFMENKLGLFMVGIMCGEVSTASAYAEFDRIYKEKKLCPSDTEALCRELLDGSTKALEYLGNALYAPAASLLPSVKENTDLLKRLGAAANMTGSGGMTVGYFSDMAKFVECVRALDKKGIKHCVFAPARTGVLHEWIER